MDGSPGLSLDRFPGRPADGVEAVLALQVASDISLVDAAVDLLIGHCCEGRDVSPRTLFRLRVAMAEALINAIERGNVGDPGKAVAVRAELFADRIRVSVSDEGPGFDPSQVPDPTRDPDSLESPCGRGLFLIRSLSEQVEFNEKGNTIWMTLPRW